VDLAIRDGGESHVTFCTDPRIEVALRDARSVIASPLLSLLVGFRSSSGPATPRRFRSHCEPLRLVTGSPPSLPSSSATAARQAKTATPEVPPRRRPELVTATPRACAAATRRACARTMCLAPHPRVFDVLLLSMLGPSRLRAAGGGDIRLAPPRASHERARSAHREQRINSAWAPSDDDVDTAQPVNRHIRATRLGNWRALLPTHCICARWERERVASSGYGRSLLLSCRVRGDDRSDAFACQFEG
jgi:hypothetical protein